jgi:quercetin dioxygenase-like cupin family protein
VALRIVGTGEALQSIDGEHGPRRESGGGKQKSKSADDCGARHARTVKSGAFLLSLLMRRRFVRITLRRCARILFLLLPLTALGQAPSGRVTQIDAVSVSPDRFKTLLDNQHVRVVEYTLLPGERDQWHTHPPKVSYVVTGGTLRITTDDGQSFPSEEKAGSATWMDALGRHFAQNVGKTPVRIVLVEVKGAS